MTIRVDHGVEVSFERIQRNAKEMRSFNHFRKLHISTLGLVSSE